MAATPHGDACEIVRIATSDIGSVALCHQCGTVHVCLQCISLRFSPSAALSLAGMLEEAQRQLVKLANQEPETRDSLDLATPLGRGLH